MLKDNLINDLVDDPKLKRAMAKNLLRHDTGELLSSIVPEQTTTRFTATKVEGDIRPIDEKEDTDVEVEDVEMSYDGVIQPMDPAEWSEEMKDCMERVRELMRRRPMTAPFGPTVGLEETAYSGLTTEDK